MTRRGSSAPDGLEEDFHLYTEAGIYGVALTVTDDDGEWGAASYEYVVVYDTESGNDDDATTALGNGSIVIHTPKKK